MNLADYLADSPRGTARQLAAAVRVHPVTLSQWSAGVKQVPVERCPSVERATEGRVTCEEMRPDVVWVRVPDDQWPWHASGRPLLDVTALPQEAAAA